MKAKKTKKELRSEMEQQVQDFLHAGGEIKAVPRGQSGLQRGELVRPVFNDGKPKESRTPVNEVVQHIDARRSSKEKRQDVTKPRRLKRKVIYDDFGEPIREVWE